MRWKGQIRRPARVEWAVGGSTVGMLAGVALGARLERRTDEGPELSRSRGSLREEATVRDDARRCETMRSDSCTSCASSTNNGDQQGQLHAASGEEERVMAAGRAVGPNSRLAGGRMRILRRFDDHHRP
jgi:hypothetical protein